MILDRKSNSDTYVYVDDFGAKGDGVSNDTAAFSRAIAYAIATFGGGTIQLGPKTYALDGLIISNSYIKVRGVNSDATTIIPTTSASAGFLIKLTAEYISMESIFLYGINAVPTTDGIVISSTTNGCYFEDIYVSTFTGMDSKLKDHLARML